MFSISERRDDRRAGWIRPALRVIPLAIGFGLPTAWLAWLAVFALVSAGAGDVVALVVAIVLAAGLSTTMTLAFSYEAAAPRHLTAVALVLGLLAAAAFFVWFAPRGN